jgi:hypothetical protein
VEALRQTGASAFGVAGLEGLLAVAYRLAPAAFVGRGAPVEEIVPYGTVKDVVPAEPFDVVVALKTIERVPMAITQKRVIKNRSCYNLHPEEPIGAEAACLVRNEVHPHRPERGRPLSVQEEDLVAAFAPIEDVVIAIAEGVEDVVSGSTAHDVPAEVVSHAIATIAAANDVCPYAAVEQIETRAGR